jgi:hypothetical protein
MPDGKFVNLVLLKSRVIIYLNVSIQPGIYIRFILDKANSFIYFISFIDSGNLVNLFYEKSIKVNFFSYLKL